MGRSRGGNQTTIVLHRIQVSDTGLQFAGLVLSPFFNTAVTLACWQSMGTCPVLYDCWYIANSTGANSLIPI